MRNADGELLPTVVRKWIERNREEAVRLGLVPKKKPWYKSKRFWSAAAFALSSGGAIANKVAGGNQAVEVAALSCTAASGLITIIFGLKDSGTVVELPKLGKFGLKVSQSNTVKDFVGTMRKMADTLNRKGK